MTTNESPFSRSGLRIFANGYRPLPLMPREKRPGEYKGIRDGWRGMRDWAKYCREYVLEVDVMVWSKWPDANIGVAHTSEFIGFDFDLDVAGCHDQIKAVLAELPGRIVRRKGAKGYMQYFRSGGDVPSGVFKIGGQEGNALEILGAGRQSVLPPSIHPETGRAYEWITDDTLEDTELEDLPLVTPEVYARILEILRSVGWDEARHNQMQTETARTSREVGQSRGVYDLANKHAMQSLWRWVPDLGLYNLQDKGNGGYCAVAHWRPSGSGRSLDERKRNLHVDPAGIVDFGDPSNGRYTPLDLVSSALGCGLDQAWDWLWEKIGGFVDILPPWSPAAKQIESEEGTTRLEVIRQAVDAQVEIRNHLTPPGAVDRETIYMPHAVGGHMERVMNETLASARRRIEQFALMSALGIASACYGRNFCTPTGSGLNLMMCGIGRSGIGKDHYLSAIKVPMVSREGQLKKCLGSSDYASEVAIYRSLASHPVQVAPMDEMGLLLKRIQSPRAHAGEQAMRKAMLELYSSSSSIWSAKKTGSVEDSREAIHQPILTVVGMSTPETFFDGLSKANVTDGLMARMILFVRHDKPERERVLTSLSDDRMLNAVYDMFDSTPSKMPVGNTADMSAAFQPVKLDRVPWADDAAESYFDQIEEWQSGDVVTKGHAPDGLMNRFAENSLRLATIRALSRDGIHAAVTVSDVAWGVGVVTESVISLLLASQDFMFESDYEKNYMRVLKQIEGDQKINGYARESRIMDRCRSIPLKEINAILSHLVSTGRVLKESGTHKNKPFIRYSIRNLSEVDD